MNQDKIESMEDLLKHIEEFYGDDPRVRLLLLTTAKAAYQMGQLGL